jgi:hypothetical protein
MFVVLIRLSAGIKRTGNLFISVRKKPLGRLVTEVYTLVKRG